MPFPYVFYSNFELGPNVGIGGGHGWDSESDTGALLDVVHYAQLAQMPYASAIPYRGAYCLRGQLGDTNDHTITEGDVNIASASWGWFRWYLNVLALSTTAQDIFPILELQSPTTNTLRTGVYLRSDFTGGATTYYQIGVGGNEGGAVWTGPLLQTNRWYPIELSVKPSNTTDVGQAIRQDNGAATLYIHGAQIATSAIIMTGGADASIGAAILGTQDTVATTTGTILFDEFVFDGGVAGSEQLRVYPITTERFSQSVELIATAHVFVGPGTVENVTLVSGGATNNRLRLFDTDQATGYLEGQSGLVRLRNLTANEIVDPAGMPVHVRRGCFVVLEGTNPRAIVKIGSAPHYSAAGYKILGSRRKATGQGEVL